jgi:NADH-quinone oxidoreductase subunit H
LPIGLYILASVIKSAIVLLVLLTSVAYTVWLERKVVGHMQNRWGPTRVGPFGLLQPAADGLKFLFKEDLTPPHVYKPLFLAAPLIAVVFALTSIAVIPFGNDIQIGGYTIPLQITTDLHWRLRCSTRGLVVEQQVFPARRFACQCTDGEL